MRRFRFSRPPRSLRQSTVHLDNVALVPASLLPFRAHWQQIANALPRGDILIVLPDQAKQRHLARSVALLLRAKGKRVKVIGTEETDPSLAAPSQSN